MKKKRPAYAAALDVLHALRAAGHESFFAGGCVRDRLLNRQPKDYDIATAARPEQVLCEFPRARCVGAKFGVVLVRRFGHDIEVATFRTDGQYEDGRRPEKVAFGSAEDDAKRRDFTVNGLFFDPVEQRVIDYVGGQADLADGIIRTIGDADERFEEDHLRLLRAVRFAARFSFSIDADTMVAIQKHAKKLARISPERILMELSAILTDASRSAGWRLLIDTHVREELTPAWRAHEDDDQLAWRRLTALPQRTVDPALAFAACLPPDPAAVCRSLRMSNRAAKRVEWLISTLLEFQSRQDPELPDLKTWMANEDWPNLFLLIEAHLRAAGAQLGALDSLRKRAAGIPPGSVSPAPLLLGNDLLELGVKPGPQLGEILDAAYRAQLNESLISRKEALAFARRLLGS